MDMIHQLVLIPVCGEHVLKVIIDYELLWWE